MAEELLPSPEAEIDKLCYNVAAFLSQPFTGLV